MRLKLEYEYNNIQGDDIINAVKVFEAAIKHKDLNLIAINFQITRNTK